MIEIKRIDDGKYYFSGVALIMPWNAAIDIAEFNDTMKVRGFEVVDCATLEGEKDEKTTK